MSIIMIHQSVATLKFILRSVLVFHSVADDFASSVGRIHFKIDIGFLIAVGSFAIVFFLDRPFNIVIVFFLKVIGYSVKLISEFGFDEGFYEDRDYNCKWL